MKSLSFEKPLAARGAAIVLAALLGSAGVFSALVSTPQQAWADSQTPLREEVSALADNDEEEPQLTIVAGRAKRDGNKYTFPDLTITANTDKNIRSITVQFTTAIESGDDVLFTADDGFTIQGKTANRSVNSTTEDGWPTEKWEDYLRKNMTITLTSSGSGTKGLRMIASLNPVTDIYDYNSENGHYYRYVGTPSSWTEARDAAAAAPAYMGMRGYLLTVTSQSEASFITTLIEGNTWMGGTCLPEFGTQDPTSHGSILTPKSGSVRYYWVTGPEATMNDGKPLLICSGNYKNAAGLNADAKARGLYANWSGSEPNTSDGVGHVDADYTINKGEYCIHMWGKSSGNTPGTWNDYPNYPHLGTHSPCNYIIEYGGLEDDMENPDDPDSDGDTDVDVNVDVDVYVKVDINVDPEERTITTEADSISLGQALKVGENINGGVLDPVADQITRTYTLVDANGKEILGDDGKPITVPESEVPYRAGRYKVTSTKPNAANDTEYVAGTATFTVRPATVDPSREATADGSTQAKVYEKVYDGTADFDLSGVALPGVLPAHASDVRIVADSAAYLTSEVGDTKVLLQNARLENAAGEATTNYTLAGVKDDGSLELSARIVPRELTVTASTTVKWGLAGKPLNDAAGTAISFATDEDVHDNPASAWAANMLAPRDALRVGGGISSILGDVELACTRDSDGAALDASNPQAGMYTVMPHFSEVNPRGAARAAARTLGARAASDFDAPITNVKDLGNNRYDIGNYVLTLNPAKVVVTDNAATDPGFDQIGDVVEGGTVKEEVDPSKPPISKDDLDDIVKEELGDQVPNTDPVIIIIKDGEEVDTIDPTVPGHYVVIATFPDPDGGEDKVVRFEYVVEEPAPDDPNQPSNPEQPGDNGQTGGNVVVDETVTRPVNPNGGPITKDDIDEEIKTTWPNKVPISVKPDITITLNGEEVDSIDPTRPGTYYVTAVYHDPNGGPDRIVRLTYVVEGVDEETSVTTSLHRLAQTGDEVPLGMLGLGAAVAAGAVVVSLRRKRSC